MLYSVYYCKKCQRYSIVEKGQYDFCTCGSVDIYLQKMIYENQVDRTIQELKHKEKKVL